MMASFEFDFEKAFAALLYLASKPKDVPEFDKYKAAKLLFLADKYHVVRYGRPILGDFYCAMEYGPIPSKILDLLKEITGPEARRETTEEVTRLLNSLDIDRRYKYPRLVAKGPVNLDSLSKSDLMALDHVIAVHGRKTFDELKALTHAMPAYRKAWAKLDGTAAPPMSYEDFFDEDSDAIEGAFEEMIENDMLKNSFLVNESF